MLTSKQERFAQLIATEDISQVAAYIDAGYSSKALRKTLWEEASLLTSDPKVSARVGEIRQQALETGALPAVEASATELDRLKHLAIQDKNYGAGVRCEELRGKLAGHYVERHEDVKPDVPADVAIQELCTQQGVINVPAYKAGMEMLQHLKAPMPEAIVSNQQAQEMVQ